MTDQLQPESEGERMNRIKVQQCRPCHHDQVSMSYNHCPTCDRKLDVVDFVPASSLEASEQALAQAVMDRDVKRAITRLYLDELDLAAQYADNEKTEAAIASIASFLPTTEEARDTRAALTQLQPESG